MTPEKRAELSPADRAEWRKTADVCVRLESSDQHWAHLVLSLLDALDAKNKTLEEIRCAWGRYQYNDISQAEFEDVVAERVEKR